jgi:hypothetical protein
VITLSTFHLPAIDTPPGDIAWSLLLLHEAKKMIRRIRPIAVLFMVYVRFVEPDIIG